MKTNMEGNVTYVGKFNMPYTECVNFKEKEALTISSIIGGARIREWLSFEGYANITFNEDDDKHWNPNITILESFSRSKSNGLVYNLYNCVYDKVFIYKTNTKESGFYGILLYNTEDGKSSHIFNIEYDYSKLMITLNRIINNKQNKS